MAFLADALSRVKPSATIAVTQKARDLKAQGREIISLSAGEPDFDTPDEHQGRGHRRPSSAARRSTPPSTASPELREAIVAKFKRENGLEYKANQVIVSHRRQAGALQRLHRHAEPRRRGHHPGALLGQLPRHGAAGRRHAGLRRLPRSSTASSCRPPTSSAAITPRTKWLILNSPSNPSGAAYTRAELKALTDVLVRHPHVWVMTDDMYEHLVFGDFEFATAGPGGAAPLSTARSP